jgi:prephenate dehydrogenase
VRITIVGLGLIGGSIGLALKKSNWQDCIVTGYSHRPETGVAALKREAIDIIETDLESAVKSANIVLVSTPISAIKDIFINVAPYLTHNCIVTDTASTKLQIMQWAREYLPGHIDFIGGHPMAGKEISGIEASESGLFQGCTYCLVKDKRVAQESVDTLYSLVQSLGAQPVVMDAEEHDNLVAGISHLPYIMSVALVAATSGSNNWGKMAKLASSGYRDMSRLAAGNPRVHSDLCLSNQKALIIWIDVLIEKLKELRGFIASGDGNLYLTLKKIGEARRKWQVNRFPDM